MTFTYNDPPMTPVDQVRFRSGDITDAAHSVSDETITWLLSAEQNDGSVWATAGDVAERIGDFYAAKAGGSKSVGPLSISRDPGADSGRWYARAARCRAGGTAGTSSLAPIFTPGHRLFGIGQMDNGRGRGGGGRELRR